MSAPEPLPVGAVFLSYAREDAAAAGRIADALGGFGVEVWLDQNELRGGDAWDSKIRRQIRECTLFVAVISATTQGRGEGYFRREWKLAVERTHDMAVGMPFLIPVVVDDTSESNAIVPDEFMRVQWTRLKGGVPTPQFVELVKRLLDSPRQAASSARTGSRASSGTLPRRKVSASAIAVLVLATLGVAGGLYYALRLRGNDEVSTKAAVSGAKGTEAAPPAMAPNEKSVAVLPFANMSPDKDNEFFADGMHEDVITNLTKIRELKVISRASVLAYRDTGSLDLRKVAADLGVATLLEGSVRRVGNKVRVTAQLIDPRTGADLWAESYDRDVSDIFSVQAEIAQQIAAALKANLSPGERELIETRPTQNQEAYDLYLRAHAIDINTGLIPKDDLDRALDLYERAVAKDPKFALAYVQLAIANSYYYWFGYLDPTPARVKRSEDAVNAAVRLAPDLPETHIAEGVYAYRAKRDWARALSEFLIAEKGLPNDAELYYWIGLTYRRMGQGPESVNYIERSVELNPKGVASKAMLANTLLYLRRFQYLVDFGRRYDAVLAGDDLTPGYVSTAQFEVDGDREAYFRRLDASRFSLLTDPNGLQKSYTMALLRGDYAAAEKALSDPNLKAVVGPESVLNEPVSFHRALLAFLSGRPDEAATLADQAISSLHSAQYSPRQEPFVLMDIAQAEAFAGRATDAERDATAAMAEATAHDAFDAMVLQSELGRLYAALGEREKAISVLRAMIAGPCALTPGEIRLDPLWSRLKDDPRFEQILKSAKTL
jgi:TolB-like protein